MLGFVLTSCKSEASLPNCGLEERFLVYSRFHNIYTIAGAHAVSYPVITEDSLQMDKTAEKSSWSLR